MEEEQVQRKILSRDGQRLLILRGRFTSDVVLIRDLR